MRNFANCMGEDSDHYAVRAEHSCQKCLTLERDYLQMAWDCGRRKPTLGEMSSDVRTEDGRAGGFLHATELSSRQCLAHRRVAIGDVASCRFISWQNPLWVSTTDPVRKNKVPQHTFCNSPTLMSTNSEGQCFSTPRYPSGEARTGVLISP